MLRLIIDNLIAFFFSRANELESFGMDRKRDSSEEEETLL